jgi:hypothetical protein
MRKTATLLSNFVKREPVIIGPVRKRRVPVIPLRQSNAIPKRDGRDKPGHDKRETATPPRCRSLSFGAILFAPIAAARQAKPRYKTR